MQKTIVVTVYQNSDKNKRIVESESTKLNEYLSEGWVIQNSDIVTTQSITQFSIVYVLKK